MVSPFNGNELPYPNKAVQLNEKVLALAQDLLFDELVHDTLLSCGDRITNKFCGRFGVYETFNGEVVSFQPQLTLIFTLICDTFVISGTLTTIKSMIDRLDDYALLINQYH